MMIVDLVSTDYDDYDDDNDCLRMRKRICHELKSSAASAAATVTYNLI